MTRKRILPVGIVILFCIAAAIAAPAQSTFFTSLASFNGTDGANPYAGLVQATDGNLYGTTFYGGGSNNCHIGCGTVFQITPAGTLSTLRSFDGSNGARPGAELVQGTDGNFYGTAGSGGAYGDYGTVFKITRSGALTTLHSFDQTDGWGPNGLVQAADGSFYGTTSSGGDGQSCNSNGCGTVFKITASGTLTVLHSFCTQSGCPDGFLPLAAMVQASDGTFYGTTRWGGVNNGCGSGIGCGTLFKITPAGTLTTLVSFCAQPNCTDGGLPGSPLVQASDGNLYGTTSFGGTGPYCYGWPGCGTVFRITAAGTLTTLYSFQGQPDGAIPTGGLVQATDGNFYATTQAGGSSGNGTVFKITPSGTLTTLHSFNGTDGALPFGGVVQASNGYFYGTTGYGEANGEEPGDGTVFRLGVTCSPKSAHNRV